MGGEEMGGEERGRGNFSQYVKIKFYLNLPTPESIILTINSLCVPKVRKIGRISCEKAQSVLKGMVPSIRWLSMLCSTISPFFLQSLRVT